MEQAELGITMERFLEMHMYITSALQKNDMKAVGLQLALDLLHEKVRDYFSNYLKSLCSNVIKFTSILTIVILLYSLGKARPYHRFENQNKCGSSKLG